MKDKITSWISLKLKTSALWKTLLKEWKARHRLGENICYIYIYIYIYNSRLMSYKYIKISKFSNKKTNNQFKIGQKTSHQEEYADGK